MSDLKVRPTSPGDRGPWTSGLWHWGPAVGWAALIWVFSTSLFAADFTSRFFLPLLRWLLPGASPEALALLHGGVRKFGHAGEYFVLSWLVLRGIRRGRAGWEASWSLASVAIAAGYAGVDEVHQAFVPERVASGWDVLLDSAGATVAQACAAWQGTRKREGPR